MKRKLLATAMVIAGALVLPTLAAQDTSGMRYTSASEGFYASLRAQFNSGDSDDAGFGIENSSSRFGVRGSNDLGGGLEGFYQYEAGIGLDNGSSLSTRLGHVGVRGGFGQLQVGTFWPQSYNWVHGSTDVANWASGSFIGAMLLPSRQSRALEYTTPDISGFQAAAFIEMDSSRDGEGAVGAPGTPETFTDSYETNDIRDAVLVYRTASAPDREDLLRRFLISPSINPTPDPALVGDTTPYARNTITLLPARDENGVSPYRIAASNNIVELNAVGRRVSLNATLTLTGAPSFYFFDTDGDGNFTTLSATTPSEPGIFGIRTFIPGKPGNAKDDNDIDLWSLSSKYSVLGFDAGVSYTVAPDGLEKSSGSRKDLSLYALRLGYAQDNWYVSSWYAEDNAGDDTNRAHDTETFSLAAGIAVGKANLYAVYETQESDNYDPESPTVASSGSDEDEVATIGMQYNLGSRSRLWIEYASRDYDSNPDADDYTTIGLRHDL